MLGVLYIIGFGYSCYEVYMVGKNIPGLIFTIWGALLFLRTSISFLKYFCKDDQKNRDALPMATLYAFCGVFVQQIGVFFSIKDQPVKEGG